MTSMGNCFNTIFRSCSLSKKKPSKPMGADETDPLIERPATAPQATSAPEQSNRTCARCTAPLPIQTDDRSSTSHRALARVASLCDDCINRSRPCIKCGAIIPHRENQQSGSDFARRPIQLCVDCKKKRKVHFAPLKEIVVFDK